MTGGEPELDGVTDANPGDESTATVESEAPELDPLTGKPPKPPLKLEVDIEPRSSCERHVVVSVSREDVDRYFKEKIDELVPEAEVPGFRPGRAPRKLVENRYRKQLAEQVKGSLLLDAMTQVTDADDFSAISEPDFDFDAISIPDSGPFKFEFDIEVRPDFKMPDWEGLEISRPVAEIGDREINTHLQSTFEEEVDLVPHEGPCQAGDFVVVKITSRLDGKLLARSDEETICVRGKLTFPDATLADFETLMVGAAAGDKRSGQVKLSEDLEDEEMAGKQVDVEFDVLDVKRVDTSDLVETALERFPHIKSTEQLRDTIREVLERRVAYEQNRRIRDQISEMLTESADWDLPPDLLRRQSSRELDRAVMEMKASGFSATEIKTYENELRQNSLRRTEKALKEHFILERIAETHEIEATDEDYEMEIAQIAAQQQDSVRRVRARLEKKGMMDALRNQIVERKVIELIRSKAKLVDSPFEFGGPDSSGVDFSLSDSKTPSDIPQAKYAGESEPLPKPVERD